MIEVFHGTDRPFERFDESKVGSGDGKDKGGWGIYFSNSKEVAGLYSTKHGFVKRFGIPNGPYLALDSMLDSGEAYQILEELKDLNIDESEIEEFESDILGYLEDTTNKQMYVWLSYVLGSPKAASKFYGSLGYEGTTFEDKWSIGATNYVIFDTSSIQYL